MKAFIERLQKNWKTTSMGVISIVTGIVAMKNNDYVTGATALLSGIGLLLAFDKQNTNVPPTE